MPRRISVRSGHWLRLGGFGRGDAGGQPVVDPNRDGRGNTVTDISLLPAKLQTKHAGLILNQKTDCLTAKTPLFRQIGDRVMWLKGAIG